MERELLEAILNTYKKVLREISEIKQTLKTVKLHENTNQVDIPDKSTRDVPDRSTRDVPDKSTRDVLHKSQPNNERSQIEAVNNTIFTQKHTKSQSLENKLFRPDDGLLLNKLLISQNSKDREKANEILRSQNKRNYKLISRKNTPVISETYDEKKSDENKKVCDFFNLIEKEIEEAL